MWKTRIKMLLLQDQNRETKLGIPMSSRPIDKTRYYPIKPCLDDEYHPYCDGAQIGLGLPHQNNGLIFFPHQHIIAQGFDYHRHLFSSMQSKDTDINRSKIMNTNQGNLSYLFS